MLAKISPLTLSILLSFVISSSFCFAPSSAKADGDTIKIQDVPYDFGKDLEKLNAANDSFHFLRSYVDYFYALTMVNQRSLQVMQAAGLVPGWCVGDAHPENFGVLIMGNGANLFSVNDMDDSGPCPIVLDMFRLMVSTRLYETVTTPGSKLGADESTVKLEKMIESYISGLRRSVIDIPDPIKKMTAKSRERGTFPNPSRISGTRILRDPYMREVTPDQVQQIKAGLASLSGVLSPNVKILDMVSTHKVGGGSSGLLRFEILVNNNGVPLHLEMKKLIAPAVAVMRTQEVPAALERINNTLWVTQGLNPSPWFKGVTIRDQEFILRPKFWGNIGFDLQLDPDKALDDKTLKENRDVIYYEAYALGFIHSRAVQQPEAWTNLVSRIPLKTWKQDVEAMTQHFIDKFAKVKPKDSQSYNQNYNQKDK